MVARSSLVVVALLLAGAHCAKLPEAEFVDTGLTSQSSGGQAGVGTFMSRGVAFSQTIGADGVKKGSCAFSSSDGQQVEVRYVQEPGQEPVYTVVEGGPDLNPEEAYQACVAKQGGGSFGQGAGALFPGFGSGGSFPGLGGGASSGGSFPDFSVLSSVFPSFGGEARPGEGGAAGSDQSLLSFIAASLAAQREAMDAFFKEVSTQFQTLEQQNRDLQNQITHHNADAEHFVQ